MDIDGTIVENLSNDQLDKYMNDPNFVQELLPGVSHYFKNFSSEDILVFTTARFERHREMTERTLKSHNIDFYKHLIMDLPSGPRIVVNDTPNVLYHKAIAVNVMRDTGFGDTFIFDPEF